MRRSVRISLVIAAVAVALAAAPALAVFSGTDVFLISVSRAAGQQSSQWYTSVWVYNPTASTANINISFLQRNQPNLTPATVSDSIPSGTTRYYQNILSDLFGISAAGALHITSNVNVLVTSRVYNLPAGGTLKDTQGQDYAGIPASFAIGSGQSTQLLGVYQTSPREDSEFRYNFFLVETTGYSATVQVNARRADGSLAGGATLGLSGYEAQYHQLEDVVGPGFNTTNLRLEVIVASGSGKVLAVGTNTANASNDSTTFEMSFADSLLGGGLASVVHDSTLTGDGTGGNPLGLANGAVTKAKLSASGGTSGQVLGTDGTNLIWQSAGGGLALPFTGSGSTAAVTDLFTIQNTGAGRALHGVTTTDTAIWGQSTGSGIGVDGWSNSSIGVRGVVPGTTGATTGVWGQVESTTAFARAVVGWAHAGSGQTAGVWGQTESTDPNSAGVYGLAKNGYGVGGTSTTYYGVWGVSTSSIGVLGRTGGGSGYNPTAPADKQAGVWGDSAASCGVLASSKAGYVGAIRAENTATGGRGLEGYVTGSGASALYAVASAPATQAGWLQGDVNITGNLTKAGGSFKIDHPLDAANKYLYHSFVESPDMMNIYNGNVTTDGIGEAAVTLPEYFSALNRDFRYQLTVIGQFAQAIVAREIEGNVFVVETDKPYVKVSWQVTGIRKDPWANAHRIPVEEMKPEHERDTYLHPELYGQPEEQGLAWVQNPELMRYLRELSERTPESK